MMEAFINSIIDIGLLWLKEEFETPSSGVRNLMGFVLCVKEEYMREQIQWQQQPYSHNQACLDLIAAKPHGILRILDDQCSFPQVHTCWTKLIILKVMRKH